MSYIDRYTVTQVRTYVCEACGRAETWTGSEEVPEKEDRLAISTFPRYELPDIPVGWCEARLDGSRLREFCSRACAEQFASRLVCERSE